jgi:hypothetical protein
MRRRQFITTAGIASVVGLTGYSIYIEPASIEFTYHTINKVSDHKVKFAQISDLHIKHISNQHEGIGIALSKENLDFIIITGDSVDSNEQLDLLNVFMDLLPHTVPKYAILGNWEHWGNVSTVRLGSVFEKWNCELLVNKSTVFKHQSNSILLTGLDDFISGVPSPPFALNGYLPQHDHFLLAHCPQYFDRLLFLKNAKPLELEQHKDIELGSYSFSHTFSGHTHGGQINLFGLTPFVPEGSGGYVKGWFKRDNHNLYVSRGIGTSILPIRIGSVPEIAIFEYYFNEAG